MKLSHQDIIMPYKDEARTKIDKNLAMMKAVRNFKRYDFDNLQDLLKQVKRNCVYSGVYWQNNHRKNINSILKDIDLIIYDSDDGDTDEEIFSMFDGVEILLLQTASWKPEFHKYRIFIPLANPISFDSIEQFKHFYVWIGNLAGLNYDNATKDPARGFIGHYNKKGFIQEGIRLDVYNQWKKEWDKTEKKHKRQMLRNTIINSNRKKTQDLHPTHLVNKEKFKKYYANIYDGNYNNGIMAMIGYLKNCGCNDKDIEDWLVDQKFGNADREYIQHRMGGAK